MEILEIINKGVKAYESHPDTVKFVCLLYRKCLANWNQESFSNLNSVILSDPAIKKTVDDLKLKCEHMYTQICMIMFQTFVNNSENLECVRVIIFAIQKHGQNKSKAISEFAHQAYGEMAENIVAQIHEKKDYDLFSILAELQSQIIDQLDPSIVTSSTNYSQILILYLEYLNNVNEEKSLISIIILFNKLIHSNSRSFQELLGDQFGSLISLLFSKLPIIRNMLMEPVS